MQRRAFHRVGLAGLAGMLGVGRPAFAAPAGQGEIVLGQSGVLSGPLGQQIQVFNRGAMLAFDQANGQGGVLGRPVKLVSLDDELKPDRAVANHKTLLETHKVAAFFGCVGSGTTAAASKVLADSGVPAFGGYAVADSARDKAKGLAYFVRAGYGREAETLMQHLSTIGITRVACAHLDNPGGQEVLAIVKRVVDERKMQLVAQAAVAGDGKNMADAVKAIGAAEPQAVIMFLGGPLAAGLMDGMHQAGARTTYYGMSIVAGDAVAAKLGDRARGLAIAQAVPFPWGEVDADLREYHRLAAAANQPVSYYAFEGYVNASLMLDALRKAGRELTSATLHAAIRGLKTRVAGMDLDFTRGGHTGSRFIELVQVTREGRFVR